ncbi:hypothetical protein CHELA40_40088 [Chelatococcus asaccharovorans]|nr:hypothetical protein CHELA17_50106 [Chelatococcus asaccharovorans]CAH1689714.1 hypothetical protein CHELA40_40088 [Chelatococcus asaccharovorans]
MLLLSRRTSRRTFLYDVELLNPFVEVLAH